MSEAPTCGREARVRKQTNDMNEKVDTIQLLLPSDVPMIFQSCSELSLRKFNVD